MNIFRRFTLSFLSFLLVSGCGGDPHGPGSMEVTFDSGMGTGFVDASPTPSTEATVSSERLSGDLSIELTPAQVSYKPDSQPQMSVVLTTEEGEEFEVTDEATIEISPATLATLDASNKLIFSGEGLVHVAACYGMNCVAKGVKVNDGPPVLTILEPEFGAAIRGEPDEGITVIGEITDNGALSRVFVNGAEVALFEGRFETVVPASFGMNSIVVEADDGLSIERTVAVRDVLWSEEYAPLMPTGIALNSAAAIRVDQKLFDSNMPFEIPDMGGDVAVAGISEFVELLIFALDVNNLLDPSSLFGEGGPSLDIVGFSLGRPTVDFEITSSGLNFFLRMPNASIQTAGMLDLAGQSLPLDGEIFLGLSARVGIDLGLTEEITAEISAVDVALEYLEPSYASNAVNGVLTLARPEIRRLVETEFSGVLSALLGDLTTNLIVDGIGGLLATIGELNFDLTTGIGDSGDLSAAVSLTPVSLEIDPGRMLVLNLDYLTEHEVVANDAHPIPGCPVFSNRAWTEIPSAGVGLSIRPAVLNCVLVAAWRQGLLSFPVPLPGNLAPIVEEVFIDAYLPPLFGPSSRVTGFPFELQFGALVIEVRRAGEVETDRYSLSLRAGLDIELDGGAFAIELADLPEVKATLERAGSNAPLPASLIEQTLVSLVWEDMKNALLGGLDLNLGATQIPIDEISMLAPRIISATIAPVFNDRILFLEDRLSVEGVLNLSATLSPIGDSSNP